MQPNKIEETTLKISNPRPRFLRVHFQFISRNVHRTIGKRVSYELVCSKKFLDKFLQ